jgi:hypothetical protein
MASRARKSSTPSTTRSLPVEVGDNPVRWLVLGPDRAGNLLELVVMDRPAGPAVIHAMPMRTQYRRLLPKGRREQA